MEKRVVQKSTAQPGSRDGTRPGGRKRGSKTGAALRGVLTEEERARERAQSAAFARQASREPRVVEIRERMFGGRVLSRAESDLFHQQVSIRHFSLAWLTRQGIPLLDHESHYVDPSTEAELSEWDPYAMLRLRWGKKERVVNPRRVKGAWPADYLRIRHPSVSRIISPTSVLGEIWSVAKELENRYDWFDEDRTKFIVAGVAPTIPAIFVERARGLAALGLHGDFMHSYVRLRIQPWVSPASVMRAYKQLDLYLSEKQTRPISEPSLAIFEFVESYLHSEMGCGWADIVAAEERGETRDVPWAVLVQRWNDGNNDIRAAKDLRRVFERTYNEIYWRRFAPLGVVTPKRKAAAGKTESSQK